MQGGHLFWNWKILVKIIWHIMKFYFSWKKSENKLGFSTKIMKNPLIKKKLHGHQNSNDSLWQQSVTQSQLNIKICSRWTVAVGEQPDSNDSIRIRFNHWNLVVLGVYSSCPIWNTFAVDYSCLVLKIFRVDSYC